jgi:hypothetical protein
MSKTTSPLLIDEYPLMVLPSLAHRIGLSEAILLQQVHYWLKLPKMGKDFGGKRWFRNSAEEWQRENFKFWSVPTVRRLFDSLEERGIIVSNKNLNLNSWDRTAWYTINYDILDNLMVPLDYDVPVPPSDQNDQMTSDQNDQIGLIETIRSYSDTHSEIPSETIFAVDKSNGTHTDSHPAEKAKDTSPKEETDPFETKPVRTRKFDARKWYAVNEDEKKIGYKSYTKAEADEKRDALGERGYSLVLGKLLKANPCYQSFEETGRPRNLMFDAFAMGAFDMPKGFHTDDLAGNEWVINQWLNEVASYEKAEIAELRTSEYFADLASSFCEDWKTHLPGYDFPMKKGAMWRNWSKWRKQGFNSRSQSDGFIEVHYQDVNELPED